MIIYFLNFNNYHQKFKRPRACVLACDYRILFASFFLYLNQHHSILYWHRSFIHSMRTMQNLLVEAYVDNSISFPLIDYPALTQLYVY